MISLELFITLLVTSATATSMTIEVIKKLLDKANVTYKTMPTAVIIAFVVGFIEMLTYAISNGSTFGPIVIIYAICMGVANVIGSTVGYDTVKELLYVLLSKQTKGEV